MDPFQVPEVVVLRLPLYVRVLTHILDDGTDVVSSQQLGSRLQMTPAQIRKDLSYFGRFGKQGRGYDVRFLLNELRQILRLDRQWTACLVGVGRLGRAIINYPGFTPEGFQIIAAFDADQEQVGDSIGGLKVQPMSDLARTVASLDIAIGIVAVPGAQAQSVIDQLVEGRIQGYLNKKGVSEQDAGPDGRRDEEHRPSAVAAVHDLLPAGASGGVISGEVSPARRAGLRSPAVSGGQLSSGPATA